MRPNRLSRPHHALTQRGLHCLRRATRLKTCASAGNARTSTRFVIGASHFRQHRHPTSCRICNALARKLARSMDGRRRRRRSAHVLAGQLRRLSAADRAHSRLQRRCGSARARLRNVGSAAEQPSALPTPRQSVHATTHLIGRVVARTDGRWYSSSDPGHRRLYRHNRSRPGPLAEWRPEY